MRMPKEKFYEHLNLDAKTRKEFTELIASITFANTIRPDTVNFATGERVREVSVLVIELKGSKEPTLAMEAIARQNANKLVFCMNPGNTIFVFRRRLQRAEGLKRLTLVGRTLDEVWDSICAQVIFDEEDGKNLDSRIELASRKAILEAEISRLNTASRRAKQFNRKNELFAQLKQKKKELAELEYEIEDVR